MEWGDRVDLLVHLAGLIRDEEEGKGLLYFFDDGYVYGSGGHFEFEVQCGSDFECCVRASEFYDVCRILDRRIGYKMLLKGGCLVIEGIDFEGRINIADWWEIERITKVLPQKRKFGEVVEVNLDRKVMEVIKKVSKIPLSMNTVIPKVVCFRKDGIFSTDTVRLACYFTPFLFLQGSEVLALSAQGLRQLVDVMEDEVLINAIFVDGKLYLEFDGFYVGILSYDVSYPDLADILSEHKERAKRFIVGQEVGNELEKIVKILEDDDFLYLFVEGGWLQVKVFSSRRFELRRRFQVVSVEDCGIGVMAKNLNGILENVEEFGISSQSLYLRTTEGIEYVVAGIVELEERLRRDRDGDK